MFFSLVFALVIYIRGTVADTNAFNDLPTTGPTNPIYNIGEVVQLAWSMNFTGAKLTLGQDKAGDKVGGANAIILQNTNLQALQWTVSYEGLNPNISHVFYFTVSNDDYSFPSHYFYIFDEQPSSLSSVPTTSASASTSALTSTLTLTSTPVSPTAAASSESSAAVGGSGTGLSGGAIAGISIVATLAVVAVLGAAGLFIRRRWLRNRNAVPVPGQSDSGTGWSYPADSVMTSASRAQEFGGTGQIAELHGHRMQY